MSRYSVGFFVIPLGSYDEVRRLETEADEALATFRRDLWWRSNQIFRRAHEVAVVAEIVAGENEPIVDDGRDRAYIHVTGWMDEYLLGGGERHVLDAEEFATLADRLEDVSQEEFLQWSAAHASKYGEVSATLVAELFDALQRALEASPPGPHGFVYTNFRHEFAEPPPEPSEPEDTMSPADGARSAQMLQFRLRARINRQRRPWWAGAEHEEGRVLLGLVAPGRVDELARGYGRAIELLDQGEILAGVARLNEEVIPRVEEALLEPVIETMGGPVQALTLLRSKVEWDTYDHPRAVCSAEEAVELEGLLDEDTEDQVIEWIWEEERHWTRTEVRETYRKFRAVLTRAIERGHGFVWLHDNRRM